MGVKVNERPKGSGIWWVFIDYRGQRKAKKIGRDKRLAMEVAKKISAKLTLGDVGLLKKDISFGRYAKTWISTTIPATCKIKTFETYKAALQKHVLPALGKINVTDIKRSMVKEILMEKSNVGYSPTTVSTIKNVIAGVLNLAVDDEALQSNPAHRLGKIGREKQIKFEGDALSKEELSILLTAMQKHYPRHYPMALTLARTGMRLGEACALQWGDLDFKSRFISVRRSITNNGQISTPKSGKSRRVDMSKQLKETLLALRNSRKTETVRKGWGRVPEWVFISETGTAVIGGHWRERVFHKALEKAGLRRVRVHDLRHSFATQLIQNGESMVYVREQLGHHSIKLTVDTYGHLVPQGNIGAVDRLDDDATIRNPGATNLVK